MAHIFVKKVRSPTIHGGRPESGVCQLLTAALRFSIGSKLALALRDGPGFGIGNSLLVKTWCAHVLCDLATTLPIDTQKSLCLQIQST
jgi:hypothetical protein